MAVSNSHPSLLYVQGYVYNYTIFRYQLSDSKPDLVSLANSEGYNSNTNRVKLCCLVSELKKSSASYISSFLHTHSLPVYIEYVTHQRVLRTSSLLPTSLFLSTAPSLLKKLPDHPISHQIPDIPLALKAFRNLIFTLHLFNFQKWHGFKFHSRH